MQQPPPGRPGPPYQPQGMPPQGTPPRAAGPPGGRPPGGPSGQPQYGAPQYGQPQAPPSYATPPVPAMTAPRRKKRGALRFVAASCVFSAWATLIFSLLFAGGSFLAGLSAAANAGKAAAATGNYFPTPTPSPGGIGMPGAGGDELGIGGSSGSPLGGLMPGPGAAMGMLTGMIAPLCFASGTFTLVTGIVGFILFLGMAQACYALLDLEEQSFEMSLTLQTIVARLGSLR